MNDSVIYELLEQLHDIEGLDAISFWPLPIASWILIISLLAVIFLFSFWIFSRISFKRSWKNDTLKKLKNLEQNLSQETSKKTAILLSEYIRRIVIRRFLRRECAGLTGVAWLKWLKNHDPKQFNWEEKGSLLIEVPYAPKETKLGNDSIPIIKELIDATKNWVI